jgi:hypothetical protein
MSALHFDECLVRHLNSSHCVHYRNERDTKFTTQLEVLYRPGEEPDLRFCVYQLLSLFVKDDDLIGYGNTYPLALSAVLYCAHYHRSIGEVSLLTLITTEPTGTVVPLSSEQSPAATTAPSTSAATPSTTTATTTTPAAAAAAATTTAAPAKSALSAAIAATKQPAVAAAPSELTTMVLAQANRADVDEIEIAVCVKYDLIRLYVYVIARVMLLINNRPYIMKSGVSVGLYVKDKPSGKFLYVDKTEIRRTNDPVFTHKLLCVVPTMVDTELRLGAYEMKQQPVLREDRRFGSGAISVRELLEGSKARPMEVPLFDKKNSKLKAKLILHGVRRVKAVPSSATAPSAAPVLSVDSSGSLVVIGSPTNGGINPSLAALVSNNRDDDDEHKEVIQKVIEVDYDRKTAAKTDEEKERDKKDMAAGNTLTHKLTQPDHY